MATSSISGLVSGLDTASIIDQLMQLEAAPQNRLKTQQTTEKSVVAALQSVNTDVSLIGSRADTLAKPATWQTMAATSSSTAVTATAAGGAQAGSFTVTVNRLAVAHQLGFVQAAALTDVVAAGGVRLTGSDGTVHDLATGSGTLQDLVGAINASSADTGARATAVRVADGSYRLLVQATTTGAASQFTLTGQDGSALLGGATVQQGQDAEIGLGLGITATSATNTFTDLVPGVTVTVAPNTAAGTTSTVTVARDTAGVKAQVKTLVDQVNGLLTSLDSKTAGATSTAAAGVLAGEGVARSLRDTLADTIFGTDNVSLAAYGLQTDRYGKLVFDGDAFDKSYAADPAAAASAVGSGWVARVAAVATAASDSVTGTVTTAISGRNSTIDRLQDSIDDWDLRLEMRRTTLSNQYTALETALSTLKSQGDWLSGQIASLSSGRS